MWILVAAVFGTIGIALSQVFFPGSVGAAGIGFLVAVAAVPEIFDPE